MWHRFTCIRRRKIHVCGCCFCCLLTDVGKFIFCVIWNLQTPFLLKSISDLLVHWLLKFPCSSNYLYSDLISVLLCEAGEWPFSFPHFCFRCSKICLTCCNLIAGTNWFLKLLEVDGQKWSKTPDINSVIWACRIWFLGYG